MLSYHEILGSLLETLLLILVRLVLKLFPVQFSLMLASEFILTSLLPQLIRDSLHVSLPLQELFS